MNETSKTTLKDIARQAGVSTSLVSLILNGKGRASEQVRAKVVDLLTASGHKPKYLRKPLIYLLDLPRVILAGKTNSVMRQLEGIEKTLQQNNVPMQVEFLSFHETVPENILLAQLAAVANRNPGGIFFGTDVNWRDKACGFFGTRGIPVMQLGYDTENTAYDATVVDSFSGAYLAARHLIDKGHSRIGTIRWQIGLAAINSNKKNAGFTTALADAKIPLPADFSASISSGRSEPGWQSSRELVTRMLKLKQPPTAIFVENSFISMPLLYPIPGDKDAIPRQIAELDTVHFEDWPLDPAEDIVANKLLYPRRSATLVTIDWEEIGRMAAQMLIERVKGNVRGGGRVVRVNPVLQTVSGDTREPISHTSSKGSI